MHERDYLGETVVDEFAAFLRDLVCHGCSGVGVRVGSGKGRRTVRTLTEAIEYYRWRGEPFTAVHAKAESMSRDIRDALDRCRRASDGETRRLAELELLFASTKLLSWRRVYEGAIGFLLHHAENGTLAGNLHRASELMDGSEDALEAFDDRPFRSDCAMTRIYSAINQRSVVYDARLGAALGLLCRLHLERVGRRSVPPALAFMVGESGDPRRDPSLRGFTFTGKASGREHAMWNLRATWIVSQLAADGEVCVALGGGHHERIRLIEAAMFLIGKDVGDQPRESVASPPARVPRHRPGRVRAPGAVGTS